jgi:hypothetical protein
VQMCRCADVQMCRCADVQMCRCADVQIKEGNSNLSDYFHTCIFVFEHLHISTFSHSSYGSKNREEGLLFKCRVKPV